MAAILVQELMIPSENPAIPPVSVPLFRLAVCSELRSVDNQSKLFSSSSSTQSLLLLTPARLLQRTIIP